MGLSRCSFGPIIFHDSLIINIFGRNQLIPLPDHYQSFWSIYSLRFCFLCCGLFFHMIFSIIYLLPPQVVSSPQSWRNVVWYSLWFYASSHFWGSFYAYYEETRCDINFWLTLTTNIFSCFQACSCYIPLPVHWFHLAKGVWGFNWRYSCASGRILSVYSKVSYGYQNERLCGENKYARRIIDGGWSC